MEKNNDFHVTVAGDDVSYLDFLDDYKDILVTNDNLYNDTALLILTSGPPISPNLYDQNRIKDIENYDFSRDTKEWKLVTKAVEKGIPILAFERGAHLVTARVGGSLFQEIGGHDLFGTHEIQTDEDFIFSVPSSHTQMMYPGLHLSARNFKILAWSKYNLSDKYLTDVGFFKKQSKEPEIVLYPGFKALCVQFNPNHLNGENLKMIKNYLYYLMDKHLFGKDIPNYINYKNEISVLDN